jgi:adenine/guanine phosphoribosyltransferase-like PRPP-binding protein
MAKEILLSNFVRTGNKQSGEPLRKKKKEMPTAENEMFPVIKDVVKTGTTVLAGTMLFSALGSMMKK